MIPVLYRDPSLLVCVKPAGVLSQPAPGEEESLLSLLGAQEDCVLYPVHRLDRGVGGVMVCAKTSRAAAALGDYYYCQGRADSLTLAYQYYTRRRRSPTGSWLRTAPGPCWPSGSTPGGPTRSASSSPAGAGPSWGTANTAAGQGRSPSGAIGSPSPTP